MTGGERYTIDDLARLTGVTARNIRAHQSRGLLPPPRLEGRTGYYGPEHADRLRLVLEMQADGLNLKAIKRVLEAAGPGSPGQLYDFGRALRRSWEEERPLEVTAADLAQRFQPAPPDAEATRRAERLGLIRDLGDGRYEIASPRLFEAGEELVRLGIPVAAGIDLIENLRRHADGMSQAFIRLFTRHVWDPFVAEGMPEQRWPEVRDSLERLRPLAVDAVSATFRQSMSRAADRSFDRQLARIAKPRRRRAGAS